MATTRVGATQQYAENWDNIFGGGNGKSSAKKKNAKPARSTKKKTAKPAKSTKRKASKPTKAAKKSTKKKGAAKKSRKR